MDRLEGAQEALENGQEFQRMGHIEEAMSCFHEAMQHHMTMSDAQEGLLECREMLWHTMNWKVKVAV